ncbi:hypothetical protein L6452_12317 [Arctium lappa]|uniref:Uncharacterized protein n=1 Tax=Arctium lappa TaxID=4217 RepID=A0ACB9DQB9_ARCLA|nr:hypothetical protein L6452_12317 [Arctium lappa]
MGEDESVPSRVHAEALPSMYALHRSGRTKRRLRPCGSSLLFVTDMEEEHQNCGLSMVCDTDLEEECRFVEFGGQTKV